MRKRPLIKTPQAITVAPNDSAVLQSAGADETRGMDVYLSGLGIAIDPTSNGDFATMRLRVNGTPFYPFDNMTSQVATTTEPRAFNPPIYLGREVAVDILGVMGGAPSNTKMVAGFDLLLVPPGDRP